VFELAIRAEARLPNACIKHLIQIEEQILEKLAWKTGSPLWVALAEVDNVGPQCEEVGSNLLSFSLHSPVFFITQYRDRGLQFDMKRFRLAVGVLSCMGWVAITCSPWYSLIRKTTGFYARFDGC